MLPSPLERHVGLEGIELAVWDWTRNAAPNILLAHATGFHGRCWDAIVEQLPDLRCLAPDLRGHGRSSKPPPPYSWRKFGEDLAALTDRLQLEGVVGVGHSMGGHSLALAAALRPAVFAALVLIDPVILPASMYQGQTPELSMVLRRRNAWDSTDQMLRKLRDRLPFSRWEERVLRDYCEFALIPADSGELILACPPEIEASIYARSGMPDANIYGEIASIKIPVEVVRSSKPYHPGQFDGSPAAPDLAERFPQGTDHVCPDLSHFIPMEATAFTAERIQRSADAYLLK